MMRITMLALGSRGDTQPYVALARALTQAGHTVRVVAGEDFEGFVRDYGLDYAPSGVNFREFEDHHMRAALESGRNTFQAMRNIIHEGKAFAARLGQGIEAGFQGADVVISGLVGMLAGHHVAEKQGTPMIYALTIPVPGRTRAVPNPLFPVHLRLGGWFNLFTHTVFEQFLWQLMRPIVNPWREQVGLARLPRFGWRWDHLHGQPVPMLYLHSPAVIPKPPDWNAHQHVTGYCFLDHSPDWQPPADLVDFLDAGPPPVYVGFGSMSNRDPETVTRIVLAALRRSGQRGVLNTGYGGLSEIAAPDEVYVLHDVPHDWLFPRVAAVVHHGGAGTTGAGLRVGVPSIIVPFFGDQFFWGERIAALGVGPELIPQKRLTADRLAYAIRVAVTHEPMRQRAAALGARIRAEDGVARAVEIIGQNLT